MTTLKIAAVTILFLSIPHQAPLAGTSGSAGQAAPDELVGAAVEPSMARLESRESAVMATDGFVWSASSVANAVGAGSPSSDHLEIDGYSWSVRSAENPLELAP